MDRPLSDFAGSYFNEALGTVTFTLEGDALALRWGAIHASVESFDAGREQLRVEVAGIGSVVSFDFGAPGAARSIRLLGETFMRE